MSKKLFLIGSIVLFAAIFAACMFFASPMTADAEDLTYWSEANAPIIYGAIEISIPKDAVDNFDILDPRFRTFACDFEDGDLDITLESGEVHADAEGKYTLRYSAKDSHGNISRLDVPVSVTAVGDPVIVKRRLHSVASNWNTANAGFSRCDTGDRQIFGIYMPSGSSVNIRLLSDDIATTSTSTNGRLGFALLNNDSATETSSYVTFDKDGNYTTFSNGSSVGGVPLFTSPILNKGQNIQTTYDVELSYDGDMPALDYYRHGDGKYDGHSEADFKTNWGKSAAYAAYAEGETACFVLPWCDYQKFLDPNLDANIFFKTLEDAFDYYKTVIFRMNELIGLSFHPQKPTDQCVRAKYLVKANKHGAGLAYYSGNHIGMNSESIIGYFYLGWATLHEIAHGYQGYLGKGTMGLGEVSNNIIGHYIQLDRSIYGRDDDWLGKPDAVDAQGVSNEQKKNAARLRGVGLTEQEVDVKLYFIINLFDAIDGDKTYANMFSYYREMLDRGVFTSSTPNQDIYAGFFAEQYDVNVIPYFNAWKLEVSEDVVLKADKASEALTVLADSAAEDIDIIKEGEELTQNYMPVKESVLNKYGLKSDLSIRLDIQDKTLLEGKKVLLQKGGRTVAEAAIEDGSVVFTEIPTGSYYVRAPFLTTDLYETTTPYVTLKSGENEIALHYTKPTYKIYSKLWVTGPNKTLGYSLTLSDYDEADKSFLGKIELGLADLGNKSYSASEEFISVDIKDGEGQPVYDSTGNVVEKLSVNGGDNYFTRKTVDPIYVKIEKGYTINIHALRPNFVHVVSMLSSDIMPDFDTTLNDFAFELTEDGFKPLFKELDMSETLYQNNKETYLDALETAKNYFKAHAEVLEARYLDRTHKDAALKAYNALRAEDRSQYSDVIADIMRGGAPIITIIGEKIVLDRAGQEYDLRDFISAFDNEDGQLELDESNLETECDYDGEYGGVYPMIVKIKDSDGNVSECKITLEVLKNRVETVNGLAIILIVTTAVLLVAALTTVIILGRRAAKKGQKSA